MSNTTGSHVHDYWHGASELVVIDGRALSTWNNIGGASATWRRYFVPADEVVVPQGTSKLIVTVDWADEAPNSYGDVSLWVKPANTVTYRFVSEVQRGSVIEVPVAINEADLPHNVLSAWEFAVQYNGTSNPYNLFIGTTDLNVTAHRGYDLVPFPAHPDQWKGQTELEFVNATGNMTTIGYTSSGDLPARIRPLDGVLVPASASHVSVQLRTTSEFPVGRLELSFHGADTREYTVLEPERTEANIAYFDIPMEPGLGDGPYGNASLWEFRLYVPSPLSPTDPSYFSGTFELYATAFRGDQ